MRSITSALTSGFTFLTGCFAGKKHFLNRALKVFTLSLSLFESIHTFTKWLCRCDTTLCRGTPPWSTAVATFMVPEKFLFPLTTTLTGGAPQNCVAGYRWWKAGPLIPQIAKRCLAATFAITKGRLIPENLFFHHNLTLIFTIWIQTSKDHSRMAKIFL